MDLSETEISISALKGDRLAVVFPYRAEWVAAIKRLENRRWNPKKKQWEVHLCHLPELIKILGLRPDQVDTAIREDYRDNWMQRGLKVKLDRAQGQLIGKGAPLKAIDEATSFFIPGYKFSPKFKQKKWDGKRHLFSASTGKFPAGLWPCVQALLDGEGVEYELESEQLETPRRKRGVTLGAQTAQLKLRPYQQTTLKAALRQPRGIVQIATGGGKTLIAAHLIRALDRPTIFFVHTLELLYQAARVFEQELGIEVGILGDGQAKLRPLTVATVQTAYRALEGTKPAKTDGDEETREERELEIDEAEREQVIAQIEATEVAIFDECHHVPADTFYKVAQRLVRAHWRYGLSATPWRDDGHDLLLEAAMGPHIHKVDCSTLIEKGFLIAPEIFMVKVATPTLPSAVRAYHDIYQLAIVENERRNRYIAEQAHHWSEQGHSVLILVNHIAHGERLQALMPQARFAFGALEGQLRQEYLADLEQKLHPILIATTLADEGLDIPSLDALILAGGGKSQSKAYQRIGRTLRKAEGKTTARVLDFLDQAPYLSAHSKARLELYEQEPRFQITMGVPR